MDIYALTQHSTLAVEWLSIELQKYVLDTNLTVLAIVWLKVGLMVVALLHSLTLTAWLSKLPGLGLNAFIDWWRKKTNA